MPYEASSPVKRLRDSIWQGGETQSEGGQRLVSLSRREIHPTVQP